MASCVATWLFYLVLLARPFILCCYPVRHPLVCAKWHWESAGFPSEFVRGKC